MTTHVVVLLIMYMESAKSDVIGPKQKVRFWRISIKTWQEQQKIGLKRIDPNCIELNLSFNEFKNGCCQIKSNLILKSSLLTLDFSVWLSVQFTLNTLYLTQKHKNMLQTRIEPNCIIVNLSFHNFKNVFCQNKSDLISKSSVFPLDFSHKIQSGVLALTCSVWTFYQSNWLKTVVDEEKLTFLVQHYEPISLVKLA